MKLTYCIWVASSISCFLATPFINAQPIEADTTLTPNNTVVEKQGDTFNIRGGTRAGNNLFHSFERFSVPNGSIARFINSDAAVKNVISRVTGNLRSNIQGIIQAAENTPGFNLFLLNPNGIIFGPNASLDIRGAFVATTANALRFGEKDFFSADTSSDAVLTVNPSAFLFNQVKTAPIIIESSQAASQLEEQRPPALNVPAGNDFIFVGGEVRLEGRELAAPGGNVELGGLAQPGVVELNREGDNFNLSFPEGVALADVTLTDGANVNVVSTGLGGGNITISANNLAINNSNLSAGINKGSGSETAQAGDIVLQARSVDVSDSQLRNEMLGEGAGGNVILKVENDVLLDGADTTVLSNLGSFGRLGESAQRAKGSAGNVEIQARSLSILNGAQVQSETRGIGNAGDISVNVSDRVDIAGEAPVVFEDEEEPSVVSSGIFGTVAENGQGNGGKIDIDAEVLELTRGGNILTDTFGDGDAGNITINASDISLSRSTANNATLIGSGVLEGAVGDGGQISIETQALSLSGGAQIGTDILGPFAGVPGGKAKEEGDISITADAVTISGDGPVKDDPSGIFTNTEAGAEGPAGSIEVTTNIFRITDGAALEALSKNSSAGGAIHIDATTLVIVDGQITAETVSSNGGVINLDGLNSLVLSGDSKILAAAGGQGTGGNIEIGTDTLVVSQKSIISANAEEGQGGEIGISTQGLFVRNLDEQITASSERGIDGEVSFNRPDVDTNQRFVKLSVEVVNVENLVAQGCEAGDPDNSTFTITGRGALTPNPVETLFPGSILVDLGDLGIDQFPKSAPPESKPNNNRRQPTAFPEIVEAQGWIREASGTVVLTAQAPAVNSYMPGLNSTPCRVRSSSISSFLAATKDSISSTR